MRWVWWLNIHGTPFAIGTVFPEFQTPNMPRTHTLARFYSRDFYIPCAFIALRFFCSLLLLSQIRIAIVSNIISWLSAIFEREDWEIEWNEIHFIWKPKMMKNLWHVLDSWMNVESDCNYKRALLSWLWFSFNREWRRKKSDGFNTFSWQKMYFIFFPGNRNEMLIPQKSDEPKPEKSQPVMDIGTCLWIVCLCVYFKCTAHVFCFPQRASN